MFEKASKLKLRFETSKGLLSVEDLWDLSLVSLDAIAKAVNKKVKEQQEESFISEKTEKETIHNLQLEILKYVIKVKMEENAAKKQKVERQEKVAYLENLLLEKKNEELKGLSAEELQKQIAELKA